MGQVAVIGAGSWGTALSVLLARKGHRVGLWARDPELAAAIKSERHNPRYLLDVEVPAGVFPTGDLEEAITGAEVVVLAVPSHVMRETLARAKEFLTHYPSGQGASSGGSEGRLLVSLAKGIENETLMRMSEVFASELPRRLHGGIAVLSGPNHAEEVSAMIPSATVVSAFEETAALRLQNLFMTPYFRVYTNPDVTGVELGGATKNVIAIAAGISDGLGYGDNTKASLLTRGLAEMTRLGISMGANSRTFAGLSGMGDLIVTCTSRHSRNRAVGEALGKGRKKEEIVASMTMVAEGVRTARPVQALAEKYGVEMPITKNVAEVLYAGKDPRDCVAELMTRGPTSEIASDT